LLVAKRQVARADLHSGLQWYRARGALASPPAVGKRSGSAAAETTL